MNEITMLESHVKMAKKRVPASHFRVILFGSRAEGLAREGSDYDIAIDSAEIIPFVSLAKLEADLDDLPTLSKVDLVDLRTASPSIAHTARTEGKVIYEQ